MNRIEKQLVYLQQRNRKALSPYITAGDPSPELTVPLMHALVQAGADVLEIGIPFSDPMAEGEVIQAAMERALAHQIGYKDVFEMIAEFRKNDHNTPIVLMGYLNPLEQCGYESFAKMAHDAGVDGTILVDLPPEESHELSVIWNQYNLLPIYLCSPTTTADRMMRIKELGQGYLYYVSLKGVTGAHSFDLKNVKEHYQVKKAEACLPIFVGFGIKTPETAAQVAEFADGVVVGAALIECIQQAYSEQSDPIQAAADFIKSFRLAIL